MSDDPCEAVQRGSRRVKQWPRTRTRSRPACRDLAKQALVSIHPSKEFLSLLCRIVASMNAYQRADAKNPERCNDPRLSDVNTSPCLAILFDGRSGEHYLNC